MENENVASPNLGTTIENEKALIGAVMRDGRIYEKAREIVSPLDFYLVAYGFVWDACDKLHQAGMSIDTITIGDELDRLGRLDEVAADVFRGRAALSKIREQGDPRNFLSYAENVQDYASKRRILQFLNKGAEWATNGRRAKDILSDMMQSFSDITIYSSQDEYTVPVATAAAEALDATDRAARGENAGVKTGLIDLDKLLGSLSPGNVYILAGRPGTGKTAAALTIIRNAAKAGKRILFFTLEMGRAQIVQRLAAQESGIDLHRIVTGKLRDEEWPVYVQAIEEISAWPITVNDLSSININQIRQTTRKIEAAGGVDLVAVDYLQLASAEKKKNGYERRDLEISEVSRGLKYLAREMNVPILALAQLSRAVEQRSDKRPILSDLRESGSLEQDAYGVMFLHKNETDPEKAGIVDLIIAKHRNGPVGTVGLLWRASLTQFDTAARWTADFNH